MNISTQKNTPNKITTKQDFFNLLHLQLNETFDQCNHHSFLIDGQSESITMIKSTFANWIIPSMEKEWLLTQTKLSRKKIQHFYIDNRETFKNCDKNQYNKDQKIYPYCNDGLYFLVHLKDNKSIIIIFINNWQNEKSLTTLPLFENKIEFFTNKLNVLSKDFDNFLIHQKIESLVLDKKSLDSNYNKTKKILKEEF